VPILPYYVAQYGAGGRELGWVVASFALMQFVFAPVWGRISDRIGRRPVFLVTIAGNAVALVLLGLVDSIAAILVARVLAGAFSGNVGVATAYITDVTSEEERPRWMGLVGAAFAIGFTLGPALGGALSPLGYAVPMFFAAALSGVNLLLAAVRLHEPTRSEDAGVAPSATRSRLAALRLPGVAPLALSNLVFGFAVTQLETIFVLYLLDRFGLEIYESAAIMVGMAVVMGAIQGRGMKSLAARYGERQLVAAGAALLALGFAAAPEAPTVAWLLLPLAVAAVGRALIHPSLTSLVSYRTGAHDRGVVMGTFQSAASAARVIGPVVAGFAYDRSASLPFWIAALAALAVMGMALRLPRPAQVPPDTPLAAD